MLAAKAKLKTAIPFLLQFKQQEEEKAQVSKLYQLLEPIDHLDLGSDASDYSEISDVFEEFHCASRTKGLTKREADLKAIQGFSEDFKRTVLSLREESNLLNANLFHESDEAIKAALQNSRNPIKLEPIYFDNIKITPINPEELASISSSIESTAWHLLGANTTNQFQASPAGYNIFQQKEKHWLERPEMAYSEINQSIDKCEKWLSKNNE